MGIIASIQCRLVDTHGGLRYVHPTLANEQWELRSYISPEAGVE